MAKQQLRNLYNKKFTFIKLKLGINSAKTYIVS